MLFSFFMFFFRGFSKPFCLFGILIWSISLVQMKGWNGLSFFSFSETNLILIFTVLVIFFLSLNVASKQMFLVFILFPTSLFFFLSQNILFFCLVFEWTIFPLVLMISWCGSQPERMQGFYYFIFFSIFSSYPFLVSFSTQVSSSFILSPVNGTFLFFSFLFPFLVKLPMFFFHSWLPKAHVEAPTLGSIILAGLMLKFGVWGLYQMNFLILLMKEPLGFIFVVGMLLGSLSSLTQSDSKSLVAYSSVCHMNFLGYILFSKSIFGGSASVLIILTHGVTSSLMFWVVGGLYKKIGSRQISYLSMKGFLSPSMLMFFNIIIFSNFGVPPTLGFWGEMFFLYIFFCLDSFFFFISLVYLMLVCYFSVYLLMSVSRSVGKSKSFCQEESFMFCCTLMLFFFPVLKIC